MNSLWRSRLWAVYTHHDGSAMGVSIWWMPFGWFVHSDSWRDQIGTLICRSVAFVQNTYLTGKHIENAFFWFKCLCTIYIYHVGVCASACACVCVCVSGDWCRFHHYFSHIATVSACCMRRDNARVWRTVNIDAHVSCKGHQARMQHPVALSWHRANQPWIYPLNTEP